MMNAYKEMMDRHQKEIHDFPIVFAFGDRQFAKAMHKLGLTPEDTDKIVTVFDCGDIIRKADAPAFMDLMKRQREERADAIAADKTGDGFIFDMFNYELSNHEYAYTGDYTDAIRACGLSEEKISADKALLRGFKKAIKAQKATDWC